ncbi:MAG: polysaccharide biosynthesis/export family protein [Bergeyella zoohelcum]|nr:polysaccharide biosynthesis/export family protein [Bergeyella zoohelcum]
MLRAFTVIVASLLLSSCHIFQGKKKDNELNYLKNIEEIAVQASQKNVSAILQEGDRLIISVSAKDLDVVRPFNQNYSSSDMVQSTQISGNTPQQGQTTDAGPSYYVDNGGNIMYPYLGAISAKGKTTEELRDEITSKLRKYIIDPVVNARLVNYKITVLGEVTKPGEYTVTDGRVTLLSALGMAGDLTIYGKRDDVLVVRNIDGEIHKERINLADASFINSPYYHLKQGDVIYVSSNKTRERTAKLDPNNGIYISVASIIVTILALIIRRN